MNRKDFSIAIITLLYEMMLDGKNKGYVPFPDYLLRSTPEQKRLFDLKLSKCDGIVKTSRHQTATALDIYFFNETTGKIDWENKTLNEQWHKRWEELGGNPIIEWDIGHYS